jgi:hypothetical protein
VRTIEQKVETKCQEILELAVLVARPVPNLFGGEIPGGNRHHEREEEMKETIMIVALQVYSR